MRPRLQGSWVLWEETHEWWHLPEPNRPYPIANAILQDVEAMASRRRVFVDRKWLDKARLVHWYNAPGAQLAFDGDLIGVITNFGEEWELVLWDQALSEELT